MRVARVLEDPQLLHPQRPTVANRVDAAPRHSRVDCDSSLSADNVADAKKLPVRYGGWVAGGIIPPDQRRPAGSFSFCFVAG